MLTTAPPSRRSPATSNGCIEKTAAQIKYENSNPAVRMMFKSGQRLFESVRSVVSELANSYLADVAALELRLDGIDRNDLAGECDIEGSCLPRTTVTVTVDLGSPRNICWLISVRNAPLPVPLVGRSTGRNAILAIL
jgi:hypothetical protein